MKKQILCVVAVAAFLGGCSHNGAVGAYTLASASYISAPSRQNTSAEFCVSSSSLRTIYEVPPERRDAITGALNKAKRDDKPADALLNANFKSKISLSQACATATGIPVGVRLVK